MSTVGISQARSFGIEPAVGRVGRALVSWAERREERTVERRELQRRQVDVEAAAAARAAAVWGHMLP